MTTPSKKHAVIIGSGVIGAATAYYLAKSNWRVTLIDRDKFGHACSHANCGLIAPSHVLPLNEPAAILQGIKAFLTPNSPLKISPGLNLPLYSWLLNFSRHCNQRDMLDSAAARNTLLQSSNSLYQKLFADENINPEYDKKGCLFVYKDKREMEAYTATNNILKDYFNLPALRINPKELALREPALKPNLAGAWLHEHDSHLRPDVLMSQFRTLLQSLNVTILEGQNVTGFISNNAEHNTNIATAINTTAGQLTADAFIVATGAYTPFLNKHLGCSIPIQPGKGYSITLPRPTPCTNASIIFPQHSVVLTPMQSAFRIGSTMEFSGYNDTLDPARLALLSQNANLYLREKPTGPIQEEWTGFRPMTYDGKPIIDRSPAFSNVHIAAGHNMLGLSMAPATGKLITEILNNQTPHIDPTPFSINRFM